MARVVVLQRRRCAPGEGAATAPCRLGGLPGLGAQPWPRGRDGKPLVFLAQLDLAAMSRAAPAMKLPQEGALAFFAGAVVHVSRGPRSQTLPPSDASPLRSAGGDPHDPIDAHEGRAFPCWPVELLPLDLPEVTAEDHETVLAEAIRARAEASGHVGVKSLFTPAVPRWWAHAVHLLDFLVSRPAPAAITTPRAPFEAYLDEVRAFVSGRDPWSTMDDEAWAHLAELWARLPRFPDRTGYRGATGLYDLELRLRKVLPAEGQPAFHALPDAIRAWLLDFRTPRPRWWHSGHLLLAALRGSDAPLLAEVERWVDRHAPSERMATGDVQVFEALFARVRDLDPKQRRWLSGTVEDLEAVTAGRLLADDLVRNALPAVWRDRVEHRIFGVHVPPHRIGGIPTSSQGYAAELHESGEVLLLQLHPDPWMSWGFGDAGEWSFLAPMGPRGADLSAAKAVFEMG